MDSGQITLLLLIGVGLLIVSLMLRVFTQGKYEIKTIDLVFIILPLLFVGVATGKLRGLDLFGVKADLSELWAKAADTQIEQQVSTVPVSPVSDAIEMVETAEKRGVNEIPRHRAKDTGSGVPSGGRRLLLGSDQEIFRGSLRQLVLALRRRQLS
jgi:hypothetical protein